MVSKIHQAGSIDNRVVYIAYELGLDTILHELATKA